MSNYYENSMEVTGTFAIENPLYVYGLQRTPNQQRYEEMNAVFWSSAFASKGLVLEPCTQILHLQPVPLQVPTRLVEWQFNSTGTGAADTSTKWHEVLDPLSGLTVIEQQDSTAGRYFYATSRYNLLSNACFYLNLYRSEAARDALRSPVDYFTQVVIGDGMLGALRLSFGYGAPPIMEVCTDPATTPPTYQEVARAGETIPDAAAYVAGLADGVLRLRVMSVPCDGAIVVAIGQGDGNLVFRMDGVFLPAGPLTVVGQNGVTRIQYQPMRFTPLGSIISAIRDHGSQLNATPRTDIDGALTANSNYHCEVEVLNGTQSRYALTLDATASVDASGLATETPVIRSVNIFFPGTTYNDMVTHLRYMNMKRVEGESQAFDLGTLTYSARANIVCDNHEGEWTGASGYRAGYLEAGINGDNWRRLTGWVSGISQSRNDPARETTFTLVGKEHWLQRRPVGIQGPLDGYDIYAAIRFLAQLGGVRDEFMTALPYTAPGRFAPSPYYHLPVGTSLTGALFQFDPRTKIWDAMQQLARKVRGYLGFDVFGHLQFHKWSVNALGGYSQAFDVVPESYNGNLLYNQLKNTFNVRVNLNDIRSDITLGSIDPFTWQPVFTHYHNEALVTDISNPAFLGNEDTEIEISNLLFDPAMQNTTMDALAYQTSLPGLTVYLDAYYQQRVFPLDIVTVNEANALGGIYPFYVTGMNSSYGINQRGHFGQTQIAGRWLENG